MPYVFKYQVPIAPIPQEVALPADARIVHVGHQSDQHYVMLWAETSGEAALRKRVFGVFGTGDPVPENWWYVGTTVRNDVGLVWHIYEPPPGQPEPQVEDEGDSQ